MVQKLKNLFQTKKPVVLGLVLFFLVLGIIIPIIQVHALFGPLIDTTVSTFVNILVGFIFQVIAVIGNVLLGIAGAILKWVTSDNFIKLSYTNPANNFILKTGWTLTRDLANIGFVIVLIIIGLATALRIREYQWQKLLPKLVIIILLINFTPVIIGLIVDASNIIMNYFLQESRAVGWGAFSGAFNQQWDSIKDLVDSILSGTGTSEFLGKSIVLAIYGFAAAAILFVFAALFVMRYIAIWILVILSPIAFFAWILPGTKKYFTQWWHQLLQWSFIGATTAFFLYLSHKILEEAVKGKIEIAPQPENLIAGGIFDGLMPYLVVIIFLYFAFFVSLKSSAYGANTIIGWAKRREKVMGKWMGRKAGRGAQKLMGEERWKSLADRLAGGKGGIVSRVLTSPLRPIGRGMMSIREMERKTAAKAEDKAKNKERDAARNVSEARKQILLKEWGQVGGTFAGMVEQKQVKEAVEKLGVKPKEFANAIKGLVRINEKDRAEKVFRGSSEYLLKEGYTPEGLGLKLSEDDEKKYKPYANLNIGGKEVKSAYAVKLIAEASSADEIKQLKGILSEGSVQNIVHKFWTGNQFRKAGEEIGASFFEAVQANIKTSRWYEEENKKLYKYLKSNAAHDLGVGLVPTEKIEDITKWSKEDLEEMIKERERKLTRLHPEKKLEIQKTQDEKEKFESELEKREKETKAETETVKPEEKEGGGGETGAGE